MHTIPKLTDEAVAMLPLEAGRAELLEEIMSTVAPDRTADHDAGTTRPPAGRPAGSFPWPRPRRSRASPPPASGARGCCRAATPRRRRTPTRSTCPTGRASSWTRPVGPSTPWVATGSCSATATRASRSPRTTPRTTTPTSRTVSTSTTRRRRASRSSSSVATPRCGPTPRTTTPRSARSRTATGSRSARRGWTRRPTSTCSGSSGSRPMPSSRPRCPDGYVTEPERADAAAKIVADIAAKSGAELPGGLVAAAGRRGREGPLPVRRGGRRPLHLRLDRGVRERAGPRPDGRGGRGGAGPQHLEELADPPGDGRRASDYSEVVWLFSDQVGEGTVPEQYREGLGC